MANDQKRDTVQDVRRHAPALTRFIVLVPVLSLFAASVTMVIYGGLQMVATIGDILRRELTEKEVLVHFIELADLFLLAVVVYIIAIGLYELFIDAGVDMPAWLVFHDIDDLKHRLTAVVIVVIGVMFLGSAIEIKSAQELMYRGFGTASVIIALAYFLQVGNHEKKPPAE